MKEGKLKFKQAPKDGGRLTYHDPCHIGRHGGIYEPPREILRSIPGVEFVEMEHNRENGLCCGSVLSRVGRPPAADAIGAMQDDRGRRKLRRVLSSPPAPAARCSYALRAL